MRIKNEIKEAHGKLSNASVQFLEFIEKNPGSLKSSNFDFLELNDELFRLQYWPTFINQTRKDEIKKASKAIFNLINSLPKRIFGNDIRKISQYFEIPEEDVRTQLTGTNDGHLNNLLSRGDFIFSSSGVKCLEFNVTASLGGLQIAGWENQYLRIPIIAKFLEDFKIKIYNKNLVFILLNHLVDIGVNRFPGASNHMNSAIVIEGHIEGDASRVEYSLFNKIYKNILEIKNPDLKGELIFCDYQHLQVVDNYLYYRDKKIPVLLEMYNGFVPGDILKIFKSGNIILLNGPITNLLSNKLNLALLSEYKESDIFSVNEREIIDKYIPWTRKLTSSDVTCSSRKINIEDFALANREKLVLKPANEYGGLGIYIGKNTPEKIWTETINNALKQKNFLLQEYVESDTYLYQLGEDGCAEHEAVWGFFLFGNEYAGGWVRVLPKMKSKGILNCHQGAKASVVFEVKN